MPKNKKKIIKRKQPTLAAFNFTMKVKHNGEMVDVRMPLETTETLIKCEICDKTFKSQQGLGNHSKSMHGVLLSKENIYPSQPKKLKLGDSEMVSLAVKDVVDSIVNKVASSLSKSEGVLKIAGKKRHQYSAAFKSEAINAYENGANQETIAESFGVTQSQISRWIKQRKTIQKKPFKNHLILIENYI